MKNDLEVGSVVFVLSTNICNAPSECLGEEGIVLEVLDGLVDGIRYKSKVRVGFVDSIAGYRDWLFDFREVDLVDGVLPFGTSVRDCLSI